MDEKDIGRTFDILSAQIVVTQMVLLRSLGTGERTYLRELCRNEIEAMEHSDDPRHRALAEAWDLLAGLLETVITD